MTREQKLFKCKWDKFIYQILCMNFQNIAESVLNFVDLCSYIFFTNWLVLCWKGYGQGGSLCSLVIWSMQHKTLNVWFTGCCDNFDSELAFIQTTESNDFREHLMLFRAHLQKYYWIIIFLNRIFFNNVTLMGKNNFGWARRLQRKKASGFNYETKNLDTSN